MPGLVQVLHDEQLDLRKQAVQALGQLGDARAVEPLLAALQAHELEVKAEPALAALGAPAVEPLVRLIRGKGKATRAGGALRRITDPNAVPPLLTALGDTDPSARANAALALGEIGDRQAVPALCDALQDPDSLVVKWSAEALARIGDDRAVQPLVATMKAHYSAAAAEALDALGWTPSDDSERAIHLLAQQKLAELPKLGGAAVEPLVAYLTASEPGTAWIDVQNRVRAAYVLGQTGDARAAEPLIRLLQQGVRLDQTRLSDGAVAALRQLGEPAVEPLVAVLVDQSQARYVRGYAAQALGAIGSPRAIEPLTAVLASDPGLPYAEPALRQIDAAARSADAVVSRRDLRPANVAAYLAADVGDLTHTMPQRTFELAKGWALRDTPGPLQKEEVDEVQDFVSYHAVETLERFGYELVRQQGGYDILRKRPEPPAG